MFIASPGYPKACAEWAEATELRSHFSDVLIIEQTRASLRRNA